MILKTKRPDELKAKQLLALQQAEAARKQETDPEKQKNLPPVDQVFASREISEDVNGPYEQHQGLEALLTNFGTQEPKKPEANEKVNEVGQGNVVNKIRENPDKKVQVRKPKEDDKRFSEKTNDPKSAERMGNLKVSSKKEARGVTDKSQNVGSEQNHNHHKLGSKGAPKTAAPRPVGATETLRRAKPDPKAGLRQLPQIRNNGTDKTDFSEEIKQALAAQKRSVA